MWPTLHLELPTTLGTIEVPTYALWVGLAFVCAAVLRSREVARLGYDRDPRHVWVGIGAMVGAVIGAKLGLLLFGPMAEVEAVWSAILSMDFTGKTVLGAIAGGWIGVEIAKWGLGIARSTGDGFAEPILVGQAIGRMGCLFEGCCYGTPTTWPISVWLHNDYRHPVQIYESVGAALLAIWIYRLRDAGLPEGHRFRRAIVGYALLRAALDPLRGDGRRMLGVLSAVQWACLLFAAVVGCAMVWRERRATEPAGG